MKRSENLLSRQIVELEIKVDKLALKLVKHEASGSGMSSSSEGWNLFLHGRFVGLNVSHVDVSMSICIVVVFILVPMFLNGLNSSQTS